MNQGLNKWFFRLRAPVCAGLWLAKVAVAADPVNTPGPALTLTGPDRITNECHSTFADPGARATGGPVAIAAGNEFSLALKRDGTVAAWNQWFSVGSVLASSNLSNVVAIAAGQYHGLALKRDGTVAAWGDNINGQTTVPGDLRDVVSIAAGYEHNLALRADGTVVAWGLNSYGQANVPIGLSNVVAIAAGAIHSLALQGDGVMVGWGNNHYGQVSVPAGLRDVVGIAAGGAHSLALQRDGTVVVWGDNSRGQTNLPTALTNIVAVSAGGLHSLALRSDGTVAAWGDNVNDQALVPSGLSEVVAIAAGAWHSLAVRRDGTIVAWRDRNFYGQPTVPRDLNDITPRILVGGQVDTDHPGAYTLQYRVTDLFGETATTNRTVVVLDTMPPAFVCPPNLRLPCARAEGVPVSFAPEAIDVCSGPVPVSCVPASGSLFPIGTTPVVCTATDASGNSVSCSFSVTIQGARGAMEEVLSNLQALRDGVTNPQDAKRLAEAIEALSDALDPNFWRNDTLQMAKEDRVFQKAKSAVIALLELTKDKRSEIPDRDLQGWVECTVNTLRLLAVLELEEGARTSTGSRKVAKIREQMTRGDEDVADGHWIAGIEHYRQAWNQAVHLQVRINVSASNRSLHVEFFGIPGHTYILEASTNLTDWIPVGRITPASEGMVAIDDTLVAGCKARFHRLRLAH